MKKRSDQKEKKGQSLETRRSFTYHLKYAMSIPPGCLACGNPAYPACKTSCPMFDD